MNKRRRKRNLKQKIAKVAEDLPPEPLEETTATMAGEAAVTAAVMDLSDLTSKTVGSENEIVKSPSCGQPPNHIEVVSEVKAVGARKRKPTQISKIVDKPEDDEEDDASVEDSSEYPMNNNNVVIPPHKKVCLQAMNEESSNKNGMIRSILTELKSAKKIKGENHVGDWQLSQTKHNSGEEDCSSTSSGDEKSKSFIETRRYLCSDEERVRRKIENNSSDGADGAGSFDLSKKMEVRTKRKASEALGRDSESDNDGYSAQPIEEENCDSLNSSEESLPFRCGVCHFGTNTKSVLVFHMAIHNEERSYQCRLCFYAFSSKDDCERHVGNRHGKIDKDQFKKLILKLPRASEVSGSEVTASNLSLGLSATNLTKTPIKGRAPVPTGPKVREHGIDSPFTLNKSPQSADEAPLDLSMDAMDLSTKNSSQESAIARRIGLPRPRPIYPTADIPSFLVTSPFLSKKDPIAAPQAPINPFPASSSLLHSSGSNTGIGSSSMNNTSFPMFPFKSPNSLAHFAMGHPNVENLLQFTSHLPPKLGNPFISTGSSKHEDKELQKQASAEKDLSNSNAKGINENSEKRLSAGNNCVEMKKIPATVVPSSTGRKKGDNGEYQKPKQRRYRTERPFACPHCPARFTLRSNMERHGKHQHPTVWQRSPSNRVINRNKNNQNSMTGPPTLVGPNKFGDLGMAHSPTSLIDKANSDVLNNLSVKAVIAQQLKRKLSSSSLRNENGDKDMDLDMEDQEGRMGKTGDDLASVEHLLDHVKTSRFSHYLSEHDAAISSSVNHESSNDNENTSLSQNDGEDSGDEDEDDGEDYEDAKASHETPGKKKSAYSSAPHKISCPHCTRKFPWTSSLRRHLLTHTGQKPYQCPKCPLLFTTKSNCDRHLARKHNNGGALLGSMSSKTSSSIENSGDEDEEEDNDTEEISGNEKNSYDFDSQPSVSTIVEPELSVLNSGNLDDEEERQGNLRSKTSPPIKSNCAGFENDGNINIVSTSEDAAFRCHLCEAAAVDRDVLIGHMEEEHEEVFRMLVAKGALNSSPPSEHSEPENDVRDLTHRKVLCVFCIRRFWSVEDLRRHIRSHSGERPFACPRCSRRFTLKHSMLRHLKKHAQEEGALNAQNENEEQMESVSG